MLDAAPTASSPSPSPFPPARSAAAATAGLLAIAGLVVGVALLAPSPAAAVLSAGLVPVLVACALIDLNRRVIPNRITGPAAVLALVLGVALDPSGEPARLAWAAGAGGFLLVAALIAPAGMGMGDVKLVGVMGLCLGAPVAVALFAALLGGAGLGLVVIRRRGLRAGRRTAIPFGPFLAAGGILAALVGAHVIHLYLSLHG
jgi:leader peptidase (prepilin peptidase) / N-methyltransferase